MEERIDALEEIVHSLRERVTHLEQETNTSHKEESFKRRVSNALNIDRVDIDFAPTPVGQTATVTVNPKELEDVIRSIERSEDLEWTIRTLSEDAGRVRVIEPVI